MGKYCSEKDDMVFYHSSNKICMNKESFAENCALIFPKHCKFVNYKQLQVAMELFCSHWNFVPKHISKNFSCYYCSVRKHNTIDLVGNENTTKERRRT